MTEDRQPAVRGDFDATMKRNCGREPEQTYKNDC